MEKEVLTGEWCKSCTHNPVCEIKADFRKYGGKVQEVIEKEIPKERRHTNFMVAAHCFWFERGKESKSLIEELEETNETIAEQKQITEQGGMVIVKTLQYIVKRLEEINGITQEEKK